MALLPAPQNRIHSCSICNIVSVWSNTLRIKLQAATDTSPLNGKYVQESRREEEEDDEIPSDLAPNCW